MPSDAANRVKTTGSRRERITQVAAVLEPMRAAAAEQQARADAEKNGQGPR